MTSRYRTTFIALLLLLCLSVQALATVAQPCLMRAAAPVQAAPVQAAPVQAASVARAAPAIDHSNMHHAMHPVDASAQASVLWDEKSTHKCCQGNASCAQNACVVALALLPFYRMSIATPTCSDPYVALSLSPVRVAYPLYHPPRTV